MSDFFSLFGPSGTQREEPRVASPVSSAPTRIATSHRDDDDYRKSFIERLFSPFEAPQQGLFHFTRGVAEDGFQPGDILRALGHAGRYFNPFGNTRRVDEEEIRSIFFGEESNSTRKFLTNTAIALLYDPLLFVGALKGVKLLEEGSSALRILEGATNPSKEILTGMRAASRHIIAPNVRRVGVALAGGEAQYEKFAVTVAQWLSNKYAGVPEPVREAAEVMDQQVHRWRERAYNIITESGRLRGRTSQELLAEGLELDGVFARMTNLSAGRAADAGLTNRQLTNLATFDQKLAKAGIDENLFYQSLGQFRKLDDDIGEGLWRSGVISGEEFTEFAGTHLRRMFAAWERPGEYIDRIEKIIEAGVTPSGRVLTPDLIEDTTRLSRKRMLRATTDLRSTMDEFVSGKRAFTTDVQQTAVDMQNFAASSWHNRYFHGGRFNPKAFTDDLIDYMDSTPGSQKSVDELFTYVQTQMLGGVEMPPELWKGIGNAITGAHFEQRGLRTYVDKLNQMLYSNGMSFRTINERVEVVGKREHIPELIREVLGEVVEASPRLASEASDAGKLLAVRQFTDTLSGTVRVDDDIAGLIADLRGYYHGGDLNAARGVMGDIIDHLKAAGHNITDLDLGTVAKLEVGDQLAVLGSRVASSAPVKGRVKLPGNPSYGNLAGMYVDPGTAAFISRLEGVGTGGGPVRNAARAVGDAVARATGQYKILKAVMDPVAQFRNFLGNMVLMDLAGVSPFRVDNMVKAAEELRVYAKTGDMGEYLARAQRVGSGMFQHTFSRQELQDAAMRMSEAGITRANWQEQMEHLYRGFSNIWRNTQDKAIGVFDFNEKLFKLNTFIDRYDNLKSAFVRGGGALTDDVLDDFARQASALADQALFNYADVPYLVEFARKYGVVPFATFPFKAVPFTLETLFDRPWRVLKYERLASEVNEFRAGGPEDVAKEIAALPEHVRDGMVLRMPFSDNEGRPLYVDMSFFMPWYTIKELTEWTRSGGMDLRGTGGFRENPIMSGPWVELFKSITQGTDGLGQPLFDLSDDTSEKFAKIAKYALEFVVPPSFPGGSRASSVGRAMQAYARNEREPVEWLDTLGRVLQVNNDQDDIFPRPGFLPQSQAQVGVAPGNAWNVTDGLLAGLLFGGASASDTPQQTLQAESRRAANANAIAREIARIRVSSLSVDEKRRRILELSQQLTRSTTEFATRVNELH